MYAKTFGWQIVQAKWPGRCFKCLAKYAAGSTIACLVGAVLTKCGYCAAGKDRHLERLCATEKQSISDRMDHIRRLTNLTPLSAEQQVSLNDSIEFLRRYRHIPTVRRFLDGFGL